MRFVRASWTGRRFELEDWLVDGECVTDRRQEPRDLAVAFGAKQVLHFHCLNDHQRLPCLDFVSYFDQDL